MNNATLSPAGRSSSSRTAAVVAALRGSTLHAFECVRRTPLLLAFALLYAAAKFSINAFYYHSGILRAAFSPLTGLLLCTLMVIITDAVALARNQTPGDSSRRGTRWEQKSQKTVLLALVFYLLWLFAIWSSLRYKGLLRGAPSAMWLGISNLFSEAAGRLAPLLPFWNVEQIAQILLNLVCWVLVPGLILFLFGFRWRDMCFSSSSWATALPVLGIYCLAFFSAGAGAAVWTKLGRTILYPALPEEFMQRGLMQRAFSSWMRPVNAILLTAMLAAALHVPSYVAEVYDGDMLGGIIGTLDVALSNLVYGYLFFRSGSLTAVVAIHALADVVGF